MKINPLHDILPKVKIIKEPPDHKAEAAKKLREYFKTFNTRRKIKRVIPPEPKFTLFLEPIPYLLNYIKEDDKWPHKKEFYTSFRVAYRRYMKALNEYRSKEVKKNKATLL